MSINQTLHAQRKIHQEKLNDALYRLKISFNDIEHFSIEPEELTDAQLKLWDAYTVRFSRVADMFLSRLLRTLIYLSDPGFSGSLRDFLNLAHKLGYIDDPEVWFEIRALRNISVHDYADTSLSAYLNALREKYAILIKIAPLCNIH
jgi:hypothetical protein